MTYVWMSFGAFTLAVVAGAFFYGIRYGRNRSEKAVVEKTAEVQREQLEAATNAPRGKAAVLDRLREKGL